MHTINWYPGHMAKARRMLEDNLKLVDMIIEIVDARAPMACRNPDFEALFKNKLRVVVLNKSDLSSKTQNRAWISYFAKQGITAAEFISTQPSTRKRAIELIEKTGEETVRRYREKGIKKTLRAMVVGVPNVGKSTLLSRVTNARPKIANYHFTTLNPNLGVVDLEGTGGFVIADIPGLIEGASEGVGLGHEFLRHIERTKVIIHIVDAAGTEGRDPIQDIYAINKELEAYNPEIAARPQVIAANKIDAIYTEDGSDPVEAIRAEFEPKGIKVFPMSAVTGQGVKELLYEVNEMLQGIGEETTVFAQEYFPDSMTGSVDDAYTVTYDEEEDEYVVEGPKIEKMLGYTNLDSEKGFTFFQNFLKDAGILEELESLGIQEGDTVRMYGLSFDYYK